MFKKWRILCNKKTEEGGYLSKVITRIDNERKVNS